MCRLLSDSSKRVVPFKSLLGAAVIGLLAWVLAAAEVRGGPVEWNRESEIVERGDEEREKTEFVGFATGAGFGSFIFGGQVKHDIAFLDVYYGRAISDLMGEGVLKGRWQLLGELSVGHEFDPGEAWAVSLTPLLRYQFESSDTLKPFFEGGYGVTWTDLGEPDLGGDWQFNGYIGGGVAWFIQPDIAWNLQYRFIHYSNAGLRDPNSGVNLHSVITGVTYFF